MSRYKLRFVPQGAMPVDLNMGIHMTPKVEPGVDPVEPGTDTPTPDCCTSCPTGWGVTINAAPTTGDVNGFVDAAFVAVVTPLGEMELCGGCLEWEVRKLSADSTDELMDTVSVEANGCDGATVTGTGDASYAGLWFGLYATLDGVPFCMPIIFRQYTECVEDLQPATTEFGTVYRNDDGIGWCDDSHTTGCPLKIEFVAGQICEPADITWEITQTSGTGGNGESLVLQASPGGSPDGPWQWWLVFSSVIDLSGSSFDCVPTIHGVAHPEFTITFTGGA